MAIVKTEPDRFFTYIYQKGYDFNNSEILYLYVFTNDGQHRASVEAYAEAVIIISLSWISIDIIISNPSPSHALE